MNDHAPMFLGSSCDQMKSTTMGYYITGRDAEKFITNSVVFLGTVFTGRLVEETRVGSLDAVVPTITGRAWITGEARYVIDPTDPFPEGLTIGDIWGG